MVSNDIVVNRNPPKGSAWSREEMILVLNLYFKLPYAFTEQGLAMLSGILNSDVAQPRKDFEELKLDIEDILHDQNDINEETRAQLDAISDALAELQGQKGNTSARPEIGYEAVKKQREKSQNHPQLINLDNLLTFRTKHIALPHRLTHHRCCRAVLCLFPIVSAFGFASCESYDDLSHRIMKSYYEESQGLSQASTDSVSRFSKKVNEFTTLHP